MMAVNTNNNKTTLFLGDLSTFCTERDIHMAFSPYGEIQEIKIMRSEETYRNLSYGFLKFASSSAAKKAMNGLNGVLFCGRNLRIGWASYKSKKEPKILLHHDRIESSSVHISYISYQLKNLITEESLRILFSTYGIVLDTSIKKSYIDESINRQCGYGFVHFSSSQEGIESALAAVAGLNDATLENVCYKCSISHNLEKYLLEIQSQRIEQMHDTYRSSQSPHTLGEHKNYPSYGYQQEGYGYGNSHYAQSYASIGYSQPRHHSPAHFDNGNADGWSNSMPQQSHRYPVPLHPAPLQQSHHYESENFYSSNEQYEQFDAAFDQNFIRSYNKPNYAPPHPDRCNVAGSRNTPQPQQQSRFPCATSTSFDRTDSMNALSQQSSGQFNFSDLHYSSDNTTLPCAQDSISQDNDSAAIAYGLPTNRFFDSLLTLSVDDREGNHNSTINNSNIFNSTINNSLFDGLESNAFDGELSMSSLFDKMNLQAGSMFGSSAQAADSSATTATTAVSPRKWLPSHAWPAQLY